MNYKYEFKLSHHSTSGSGYAIDKNISIEMISFSLSGKIDIQLKFLISPEEKITITKFHIGLKSFSHPSEEAYLAGFFELSNANNFKLALEEMKEKMNGNLKQSREISSEKWQHFESQFIAWFDKNIRSCLSKEEEAFNLYFKQINGEL